MTTPAAAASDSLAVRLWRYQAERFPLAGFVPLISAFAFSSVAYSRLARDLTEFVPWPRFVVGAVSTITFFFLLRVLDEHKDQDIDRRFRPELPVPRGLVSLRELRLVGGALLAVVVALNALVAPVMLRAIVVLAAWVTLMTREFFVRDWLRAHPAAYLLSHMVVLPVIDGYTTGLDWLADGAEPPASLLLFLGVTFMNGVLIEIGRKVRAPADERPGVDTYTSAWGRRAAVTAWFGSLLLSLVLAMRAAAATGGASLPAFLLPALSVGIALPGILFLRQPRRRLAKMVEAASQAWPLVTYLALGSIPFLLQWLPRRGS